MLPAKPPARLVPDARRATRFLELAPDGLTRRFLFAVPRTHVLQLRDQRLRELHLAPEPAPDEEDARRAARHRRLVGAVLSECQIRAGREAMAAVIRRLGLEPAGEPRFAIMPTPASGDVVLHAEIETLPRPAPPDPATLRIERLVARPEAGDVDRALAALAAARAEWIEPPPGTAAAPGDVVICDIEARLEPAANRLPHPDIAEAAQGAPDRLPEGWFFGNNGSALACEVLEVAPDAAPPHLSIRVHGTVAAEGQCYVMFHPEQGIPVAPGATWVGSLSLRQAGPAGGLRGGKLRIYTKPSEGNRTLRRKDCALPPESARGFARVYVSDTFAEPETAFLRMAMLFDHAAGEVDFTFDLALPRLVEGLDFGSEDAAPLPDFSGEGRRVEIGAPDPAGLSPHLAGIIAGETRELLLHLPGTLADRTLSGRPARFTVRAAALLHRRTPAVDDALATALGFDSLASLSTHVLARQEERCAELARLQLRGAALDALLDAVGPFELPESALSGELAALWPRLSAEAAARGLAPREDEATALAARNLRLRLLLRALAERHGIAGDDETLKDRVTTFLLERAEITERQVSATELAAAIGADPLPARVDAPSP
jgi:FKBP-type peptidyl-prolyl cis-trans isomerase (trigger factor)